MSAKAGSGARLVVLGSGAFEPALGEKARLPSGLALVLDGRTLIFDLGFGGVRQLARAGIDPSSVCAAFFTHRHPDHVGDLAALLFHFNYARAPRSGALRIFGPRGFSSFLARLTRAHHPWLRPRGWRMETRELEDRDCVRGPGWKVLCREVPHTTEALAFRLVSSKGELCYTGDTGFDEGLALFCARADVLVVECSLPSSDRQQGHLTVREALALSRASNARRTLLTHLSPGSEKELSRTPLRKGREFVASDLLEIDLKSTGVRG